MIRAVTRAVGFAGAGCLLLRQLATEKKTQTTFQREMIDLKSPKKIPCLDSSRVLTHQDLALVTKFSSFKHRTYGFHREVELAAAIPDSVQKHAALSCLILEIESMLQDCKILADAFHREAQSRPFIKEACDPEKVLDEIEVLRRRAIEYL